MNTDTATDNSIVSSATALVTEEDLQDSNDLLAELKHIGEPDRDLATGKFLPGNAGNKTGRHSIAKKAAARVRAKLAAIDPATQLTAFDRVVDNLVDIATNKDPKSRKEAIWASNSLMERAFGAPLKSEEELEAMKEAGGVRIVMIPTLPAPATEPKQLKKPAEFIDVEIVEPQTR